MQLPAAKDSYHNFSQCSPMLDVWLTITTIALYMYIKSFDPTDDVPSYGMFFLSNAILFPDYLCMMESHSISCARP